MANAVDYAVRKLPVQTRIHALEEGKRDPRFWGYFTKLATSSDPIRAVDDDMKKAVINELDPRSHRDAAGKWPVLRNKMRASMATIGQHYAAHGNLSSLAAFVMGLGQEDESSGLVTSLNMEETGTSTPLPGLVTSYDLESPSTPSAPIPGLVTSLSPASSGQEAPIEDPSAGEESAAFKESLDKPSSASSAAAAAAGAAPAAAKAATTKAPAKPAATAPAAASPSIWATIASALTTAGGAGAAIYSQEVQKQAATKAQQTLLSAQQQAAARAQQAAALSAASSTTTSYVLYGLLGLLGVGGLLMLFKATSGGKGRSR